MKKTEFSHAAEQHLHVNYQPLRKIGNDFVYLAKLGLEFFHAEATLLCYTVRIRVGFDIQQGRELFCKYS